MLFVTRRHKAGKQTSDVRAPRGGTLRRARTIANRTVTHTARGCVPALGTPSPRRPFPQVCSSPLGLQLRPPPDPGRSTPPALLRPEGLSGGATHLVALQLTRGQLERAGLGTEGTHGPAENQLPSKQRRRHKRGAGRRGGVPEQSPPPHFLPGGIEPEGRRLAGDSASLCRQPRWLGSGRPLS